MSDAAKKITVNRVLLLLAVLTLLAVALPFINYAPNRLVSGEGRQLWEIWPATIWMLTGAGCALSGLWLGLGLMLLACSDAIRRITTGPLWRWLLHAQIVIVPLKSIPTARMFSMPRWCNI